MVVMGPAKCHLDSSFSKAYQKDVEFFYTSSGVIWTMDGIVLNAEIVKRLCDRLMQVRDFFKKNLN